MSSPSRPIHISSRVFVIIDFVKFAKRIKLTNKNRQSSPFRLHGSCGWRKERRDPDMEKLIEVESGKEMSKPLIVMEVGKLPLTLNCRNEHTREK